MRECLLGTQCLRNTAVVMSRAEQALKGRVTLVVGPTAITAKLPHWEFRHARHSASDAMNNLISAKLREALAQLNTRETSSLALASTSRLVATIWLD